MGCDKRCSSTQCVVLRRHHLAECNYCVHPAAQLHSSGTSRTVDVVNNASTRLRCHVFVCLSVCPSCAPGGSLTRTRQYNNENRLVARCRRGPSATLVKQTGIEGPLWNGTTWFNSLHSEVADDEMWWWRIKEFRKGRRKPYFRSKIQMQLFTHVLNIPWTWLWIMCRSTSLPSRLFLGFSSYAVDVNCLKTGNIHLWTDWRNSLTVLPH